MLPKELTLENAYVQLIPLRLDHAADLARAAADGELWNIRMTSVPEPGQETAYIQSALKMAEGGKALVFAVVRRSDAMIVGSSRFYNYEAENDHIMIGYTWYAKSCQGTTINPACKHLMLDYAFRTLKCGAVEFQVDVLNERSRAAVTKLGAKQDGVLRNHKKRRDGTLRDTVSFSIVKNEWPTLEQNLLSRMAVSV